MGVACVGCLPQFFYRSQARLDALGEPVSQVARVALFGRMQMCFAHYGLDGHGAIVGEHKG